MTLTNPIMEPGSGVRPGGRNICPPARIPKAMTHSLLAAAALLSVSACAPAPTADAPEAPQAAARPASATAEDLSSWVGQPAKPFAIPNTAGEVVDLKNDIGQRPVVLVFYRGQWCPLCRGQFRKLAGMAEEFKAAGAVIYGISNEAPGELKKLPEGEKLAEPFVFLSDAEKKAMALYTRMNADGNAFVPGTFVIGKDGTFKLAERDENYRNRPDAAKVLAAVKS